MNYKITSLFGEKIKSYSYDSMNEDVKLFFDENYKRKNFNFTLIYVSDTKIGKPSSETIPGSRLICQWYDHKHDVIIFEQGDNILIDYFLKNGFNLEMLCFICIFVL